MANEQSIIPIIRDVDRGRVLKTMQAGLDNIVEAIEAARGDGTGTITLTLTVKSKTEGAYTVAAGVKVKVPEPPRMDMAMFFNEATGALERRDPRQPDLPGVAPIDREA